MNRTALWTLLLLLTAPRAFAQKKEVSVIGYYAGPAERLDSFEIGRLTHLIFSFGHLAGNRLQIGNAGDTACIRKMVAFKRTYPKLKVMLSLGGWGGCATCSAVFSTEQGRADFARSVKETSEHFRTDGIDLDWEYPAIAGYPGHRYAPEDKAHFTALIKKLREVLGAKYEISFAAGGFDTFIDSSVDWKKVMPLADRVNVMTYDLVHGASSTSGHHTPLYATPEQRQSTDNAVNALLAKGVPARKIVIGAAFYGRLFLVRSPDVKHNGLYEPASFDHGFSYAHLQDTLALGNGFIRYRDDIAKAPYAYNAQRQLLATYDDPVSIRAKTHYAMERGLGGIMFWQLADDRPKHGLLEVIDDTIHNRRQ